MGTIFSTDFDFSSIPRQTATNPFFPKNEINNPVSINQRKSDGNTRIFKLEKISIALAGRVLITWKFIYLLKVLAFSLRPRPLPPPPPTTFILAFDPRLGS